MPLYEYQCHDCNSQFELLIRGREQPHCPECDSRHLDRLLSAPAAHTAAAKELAMCRPMPGGGCGLPQCGMGQCDL